MSLTQTAYTSRQVIKYGGSGLIIFVVLWTLISTIYKAYVAMHPPYVAPTVKYGVIPKIVFPEKGFDKKTFTFEYANDTAPNLKDQVKVYILYKSNDTFLALTNYTKTAQKMGFTSQPKEVSTGVYEFDNDNLNQTLRVNVLDGSFKMSYPYKSDQTLLNPKSMPSKDDIISQASSFLKTAGELNDDLEQGDKKVSYWQIQSDGLKSVTSIAEANLARVDFYRKDLDDTYKILSTDNNQSSVSVLVTGSDVDAKRIVEVNFKDINIDRESFSTYPIKTIQQAMDQLNNGDYWPVSDTSSQNVTIRKAYLAYLEPVALSNYLQPIFVFEGDGNFRAYVPAVTDQYIK